jgi:hypothetical protein
MGIDSCRYLRARVSAGVSGYNEDHNEVELRIEVLKCQNIYPAVAEYIRILGTGMVRVECQD